MVSIAIKSESDRNLDGEAKNAALMDEQDVYDCLSAMLRQDEYYLCHDYLCDQQSDDPKPPSCGAQHVAGERGDPIDETCRSKLCEWFFQVVDYVKLQRETVGIALNYLDRFLCSTSQRAQKAKYDRKEYQLAAMTSLYIAVKIFEPLEMDATLVSKLSRGLHSAEEITKLESEMLVALKWRLNGPSPFQFVNYFLELLPASARIVSATLYDFSHFQTELATGDYAFISLRRSVIAIASILNSLEGIPPSDFSFSERIKFIEAISNATGFNIFAPVVNAVRARLLESFAKSSGYELSQVAGLTPITCTNFPPCTESISSDESMRSLQSSKYETSPVCVSREMTVSLNICNSKS